MNYKRYDNFEVPARFAILGFFGWHLRILYVPRKCALRKYEGDSWVMTGFIVCYTVNYVCSAHLIVTVDVIQTEICYCSAVVGLMET